MRARVRSRRRRARHGRARRAPAQSRARARRDRTAPTAIGRYGRRARRAAACAVTSARRARSASRCARSRSRAMALRCAWALESFEAFSLTSSPAKRSRRLRSSARADSRDAFARHREAVVGMGDLSAQHLQRQPGAEMREAAVMRVRIGLQAAGQGGAEMIQPLPRDREQFARPRQRAGGGAQFVAAALLAALPAHHRAPREALDLDEQFAAHRHRHFGRGGRRRRALVGGEIDQRDVGLVADRRDQRDHAVGGGANHDLLVERPQILQRAAAARDDQQIRPRNLSRLRAAR